MINVVMISHSPHLCGAERMLLNLAILLNRSSGRFRPIVLVPDAKNGILAQKLTVSGIEWFDIPSFRWFLWYNPEKFVTTAALLRTNVDIISEFLATLNADIVLVNTLTSMEGSLAAHRLNLPILLWVHGIFDAGMLNQYTPLAKHCEDLLFRIATKVVYCSQWTANGYLIRCENQKSSVIHNWTECTPSISRTPSAKKNFVMLSTLEAHKGIDVAIRAIALLRDQAVYAELDIYGDGADKYKYIQLVDDLNLNKQIHFFGRVDQVNSVYDTSFALVFPSFIEPFGMLAIEAMSRAMPIIVAEVGGLKEIVRMDETGLFFKAGDYASLADKMKQLLDSPILAEKIGHAGYEHVKASFNGDRALEDFIRVIESACHAFPGHDQNASLALNVFDAFAWGKISCASSHETHHPLNNNKLPFLHNLIERGKGVAVVSIWRLLRRSKTANLIYKIALKTKLGRRLREKSIEQIYRLGIYLADC